MPLSPQMSDMLLYTYPLKDGKYRLRSSLPVSGMKVPGAGHSAGGGEPEAGSGSSPPPKITQCSQPAGKGCSQGMPRAVRGPGKEGQRDLCPWGYY